MLSTLFGFEIRYHFRQLTFRIAVLLFFILGLLGVHGNFGGSDVHANAPYVITYIISILSLFSIFVSTLFCANVVLRDTTYGMDAVLFTTAVKRFPYFTVRFLGLVFTVLLILCASIMGMLVGALFADSSRLGAFDPAYFIQPLLIFGIPNILFVCSVIFCTAALTRDVRATYASGVLLYILYMVSAILGNSPFFATSALKTSTPGLLPLLSDPFGLSIFFGDTRSWSTTQCNQRLFPFDGPLLLNRLLWTACSCLLLTVTYRSFVFRLQLPAKAIRSGTEEKKVSAISYRQRQVHPEGLSYVWNSFCAQFRLEAVSVFKHIPFLLMVAMWIFIFSVELKDSLLNGVYGIQLYPATNIIVDTLLPVRPAMLLIIFYTAELSSRERSTNTQSLLYSTPVSNMTIWAAKCSTLGILIAILITANITIGLVMQICKGYWQIDLPMYISLYYYSGFPLFLFTILTLFIQTLTPNKYLGMLLNLLAAAIIIFGRQFGIEHYLFRYAQTPRMNYSAMSGVGHYAHAFNWYMLYWSALAALLSLMTVSLWQRSRYINNRWRQMKCKLVWLVPLIIFLFTGAFIYYKANIEGGYKNNKAQLEWLARYEQGYRPLADLPQPVITAVKTNIDLYPEEGKYTVKGSFKLRNVSSVSISKIWVGVDPEVTFCSIYLPGVAHTTHDKIFHQYWYELKTPLLPDATTTLQFAMEVIRSGFTPFNSEHTVVTNGTYIELEKYLPFLGYNDRFEISDNATRRAKGLPEQAQPSPPDSTYHLIDFETTVSTTRGQYVVTAGVLQKTWAANNRQYFHYKTSAPVNYMFALSSARYAIKKESYKGVDFSILFHPGQTANLPVMMRAMKDAIDYCSQHFGPYPHTQLLLVELPEYKGAATAYPGVVFSAENINFLGDFSDSNKVNHAYGIIAHEVAHQWWANKLSPVFQPGAALLTETLAQYTEAMLIEHAFGKMFMRDYLGADNRLYFSLSNTDEQELPLARTSRQPFVHYQKGSLAMYGVKEIVGEERMNKALHRLMDKHAYPGVKASADDLVNELCQDASESEIRLIKDWLEQVIVYALKVEVLSCKRQPNGQYKLLLNVHINKTDRNNNRSLFPDENIDIAVFDVPSGELDGHSTPIYSEKHHFSGAMTHLNITVSKPPKTVAVDPYCYLPDANQADNLAAVK
ncbi:ABC transporter permease/M1 family aminopeptidase [Chitinophaga ginsengisoli]|uniref:Peptidase M1-like protein n=1 Tax=Chitinophaga ginsengisoli TaxID=363837 RepID=A0A2P8GM66_9BACT|nr:M1 family aminopeptidase [Chitinophaga ginsengisoli]PSL35046.1 peptidase M1-like protein [Chitinophaga ginsengisoli]